MPSLRARILSGCVVGLWGSLASAAFAGVVAVEIEASGQQFVAFNTSDKPITPRLVVRGWTDRDGFPPRHALGLRLNGLEIAPARMLTGATWILEPDGKAHWGYRTGSFARADGAPPDPRGWVYDPDRLALDHWPALPGHPTPIITVAYEGRPHDWFCRLDFPGTASLVKFSIQANAEQCGEGRRATPVARLFADPDRQKLLAERPIDFAAGGFVFEGISFPETFYLELSAVEIKDSNAVGLYWVWFSAELATKDSPRLTLQPGANVITAEDLPESSHRWRVRLEDPALRDNPPQTPEPALPEFVTHHRSRFRDQPIPEPRLRAPADCFPLGLYHGLTVDTLDFSVDDFADLHCNAVYGSNMNIEQLGTILDLLDRSNVKLIYQGGSSASLLYQHRGYFHEDVSQEVAFNEQFFVPAARRHVPQFRGRPGLLAWSLGEEVAADVPERLPPYYQLLRELDPTHWPVFLHNSYEAAKSDLARNRPAAVTFDCYPFALDPQVHATTLASSLRVILSETRRYRQLCDEADVPFWLMGQTWGEPSCEDSETPPYGLRYGMRTLPANLVRMQGWAAIAEGARGLFFFLYTQNGGMGACRDRYWRKTERWYGVQRLFGDVAPVTPLLLRLRRVEEQEARLTPKEVGSKLLVRVFQRRDPAATAERGCYAVVFNSDEVASCRLALAGPAMEQAEVVWDYRQGKPVAPEAVLEPGEGTLLWIGSRDQPAADASLLKPAAGE